MKQYVVYFSSGVFYNAETPEDALEQFKNDYPEMEWDEIEEIDSDDEEEEEKM